MVLFEIDCYKLSNSRMLLLLLLLLQSRFSHVLLCATPQTAAHQAPPSLGFSRQESWSGLPFPSPMNGSEKVKVKLLSRIRLLVTPWSAAYQASLSMGFSRQEYWSGVPLPSPNSVLRTSKRHFAFLVNFAFLVHWSSATLRLRKKMLQCLWHFLMHVFLFSICPTCLFLISIFP